MLALICAGGLVAGSAYGGVPSVVRCPSTVIISGIVATLLRVSYGTRAAFLRAGPPGTEL
jgi:hypothetical protein